MANEEPVERDVQEVRCAETGVPLPSIPSWYAKVRVKFISDAVRQRSSRTPESAAATAAPRRAAPVADADAEALEDPDLEVAEEAEGEVEDTETLETEEE